MDDNQRSPEAQHVALERFIALRQQFPRLRLAQFIGNFWGTIDPYHFEDHYFMDRMETFYVPSVSTRSGILETQALTQAIQHHERIVQEFEGERQRNMTFPPSYYESIGRLKIYREMLDTLQTTPSGV